MKPIIAKAKFSVNYLFHLLAVSRVGFDSEYADLYADSVIPEDREFLSANRELFTFGAGRDGGDLVDLFLLLSYFDLGSTTEIGEFFLLLDHGFQTGSLAAFLSRYRVPLKKLREWWIPIDERSFLEKRRYREEIGRLANVIARNHAAYLNQVWSEEQPKIELVADRLNAYLTSTDLIDAWEHLLGGNFKSPDYSILLCSAIKNGPNANSLGYDCNIFYSETDYTWMRQFISHEVGTHLLIDVLHEIGDSGKFEWSLVYGSFECLAKFFNQMVLHDEDLVYKLPKFHDVELLPIFDSLYRQSTSIEPRNLLVDALELYQKSISK